MSRYADTEGLELAGLEEVAGILDVPLTEARRLVDDGLPPFPKPLAELDMGRIWNREHVEEWVRSAAPWWRMNGDGR